MDLKKELRKIILIGSARHGKDTVAEFICEHFGVKFKGSSVAASEIFLYDALKDKYGYSTPLECFEDRVNHRKEWHDLITDYNKDNKSRLAEGILEHSDMYVGMRSKDEIDACVSKGLVDLVVGVYDPRKPLEHRDSFNIDIWEDCDVIIPNYQGLKELENRVIKLFTHIYG